MTDADLSTLRFLIIDDDVNVLELVTHKLKNLGVHYVATAGNGVVALEKLRDVSLPIDIIVLDLNMPEMDGLQFLRHLGELAFPGGVILLSGMKPNVLRSAHRLAKEHALNILGSISKEVGLKEIAEIFKQVNLRKNLPEEQLPSFISKYELSQAIDRQQIEYVFQPKVKISTREIDGVEMLARWKHPDFGAVSPKQFIKLAEQSGLIDGLTKLVYNKGMDQAKQWLDKGINVKVSFNAAAESLAQFDFADFVVQLINKKKIPPEKVVIEVTESQLMHNFSAHLETLTRLQMHGIGLSIDDFGKGYSTLEQLERIPFTELKIDRDFVTGVERNSASTAILESTIDLAKKLQIETVAEGVESARDWDLVEAMGCDDAQGFYISPGLTGAEFEKWYVQRNGRF